MTAEGSRVLVVDDHVEMVELLADELRDAGYVVDVATSGKEALGLAERRLPDVVLTDLRMKGTDGFDVLEGMLALEPELPVLIMTAFGAVDTAVEAMRRGAFHYLTKPFRIQEVFVQVERALEARRLRAENRSLRRMARDEASLDAILGVSPAIRGLRELVRRVAASDDPALIRGESGSGKELVARALHFAGPRAKRPFVAVNCTSLPEALLESELFGHVRGAYTGAGETRRGLFLEADGGTLFLDEIGDMPAELQAKLLRVLESREIRPVGSDVTRSVDVRIVAATHQPLEERVREGRFRQDLFFRLNVLPITVPPLRKRPEDLPLLTARFLERARERAPGARVRRFDEEVLEAFGRREWPGNVRELENLIRRVVVLADHEVVGLDELRDIEGGADESFVVARGGPLPPLRQIEDEYIAWVLEQCGGNKTKAAEVLGIDVSTIYRRERR